jgi:hypothetical protein
MSTRPALGQRRQGLAEDGAVRLLPVRDPRGGRELPALEDEVRRRERLRLRLRCPLCSGQGKILKASVKSDAEVRRDGEEAARAPVW